jgi:hypothetical protein
MVWRHALKQVHAKQVIGGHMVSVKLMAFSVPRTIAFAHAQTPPVRNPPVRNPLVSQLNIYSNKKRGGYGPYAACCLVCPPLH